MRTLHSILFLAVAISTSSCSVIISSAVNKKFPPVMTIDKKIQTVCSTLNALDTTIAYDAEVNISEKLIDSVVGSVLKASNGNFILHQSIVQSIKEDFLAAKLGEQEIIAQAIQKILLSDASNKFIKQVDFEVNASSAPYFQNDTVFLNPFFNRIHINKIHFKKCAFLTKIKPLVVLINSTFKNYLDNLNGQVTNYYVITPPLPKDGLKISSMLKNDGSVQVTQDATLKWPVNEYQNQIYIEDKNLHIILIDKITSIKPATYDCSYKSNASFTTKNDLFQQLYFHLQDNYKSIADKSFSSFLVDKDYLASIKLSTLHLQKNFNSAFTNLNFKFTYPVSYDVPNIYTDVVISKPDFNCTCSNFCERIITGGGIWNSIKRKACKLACIGVGGSLNPIVGTFFAACETANALWPQEMTIGSVSGNLHATGLVNASISKINFSNALSSVRIEKDLNLNGNLNYDMQFNSLNHFSIGRLLFTMVTQCASLHLGGSPSVSGAVPDDIVANLVKQENGSKAFLNIAVAPVLLKVQLSTSPGLAIVSDFKNVFTCGIAYKFVGISLVLGQITPQKILDTKIGNYFSALTLGKYNHTLKIKEFNVPLDYTVKSPVGELKVQTDWGGKSINTTSSF